MSFPALPTHLDGAELAIETRSLMKRFDVTRALAGLDLEVPAGAVYVLAGPNGSGKSTAIKILLDMVRADGGTARVLGIETTADPALARAQIGYVPETSETGYEWLTAERFLRHHAAFFETWDPGYAALLCRRLKVPLRAAMRDLSKGALRSVILVSALAHRPPVLLLDEPTDGLDPLAREELMALLVDHLTRPRRCSGPRTTCTKWSAWRTTWGCSGMGGWYCRPRATRCACGCAATARECRRGGRVRRS
jgi:ABC-2 type transport system ATP-binding protein